MSGVIALLTDFGTRDWYVAAMKGVLLRDFSHARLVDISHEIPAGDIQRGRFLLSQASPWFPPGTVFLAVVDPGVGTTRDPVAIEAGGSTFVGPDNGLFGFLDKRKDPDVRAYRIDPERLGLRDISPTFQGRDLFAPAAARLAAGEAVSALGPALGRPLEQGTGTLGASGPPGGGVILHIDHFGNAITNLDRDTVRRMVGQHPFQLKCGRRRFRLVNTYGDLPEGEIGVLFGSGGFLEIACHGGNAGEILNLERGARVVIEAFREPSSPD